ncbi:MAG: NADPH:quinone oxidoreductase family protein [Deltaproteobacteria bacterium]|nr:NADPH:quinone oxidoreductase family protein [Deltaproteobacteria bacterium]
MRAIVCKDFCGPEGLRIEETPSPDIKEDEVKIRVHAAGVNFHDILMVKGLHQKKPDLPFIPGTDASGEVIGVGKAVTRIRLGDRVSVIRIGWGAFAEEILAKECFVSVLPPNVDYIQGSAFRSSYGTAYYSLSHRGHLKEGEVLVVLGAAGGIGLASVELGKLLGARVIGAVGSDEKMDLVKEYGAQDVINYETEDLKERIRELTGGKGGDVFIDVVGGKVFDQSMRCMNWEGRMLVVGFASGKIPTLRANLPLLKNASVIGILFGRWLELNPDDGIEMNTMLLNWIAEGRLKPYVSRVFPLEKAAEAMQLLWDRKALGKVILTVR